MRVRDLQGWPPQWQGALRGSGQVAHGEEGILVAVRWDLKNQSCALAMEDGGQRYSGLLEGEVRLLTKLYLLLGWHIGRPLAKIGSLEMTPTCARPSARERALQPPNDQIPSRNAARGVGADQRQS